MLADLLYRLRALFRRGACERELDEELAFHLEQETAKYQRAGLGPDEAKRRARIALGSRARSQEECREARGVFLLETMLADLRYGWRGLERNKGFAATAILTLALGIGATTALFSITHTALLKPLPYKDADHLVLISQMLRTGATGGANSYPRYLAYREQCRSLAGLAAFRARSAGLSASAESGPDTLPEQVPIAKVSANFFDVLGVQPVIGRTFLPAEEAIGGPAVAIISHELWMRRFQGARDVAGKELVIDSELTRIIGVMPPHLLLPSEQTELWLPRVVDASPYPPATVQAGGTYLMLLGRLGPGQSVAQVQSELDVITARYVQQFPGNSDTALVPRVEFLADTLVSDVRATLLVLLASVGLLLLLVCANLANLLLARSMHREREMSVRVALGATRGRLIGQMLTESLLLGGLGGVAGLLLAQWTLRTLISLGAERIPRLPETGLDGSVLLFVLGVSLLTSLLFGLAPAWQTAARDVAASLKSGGRSLTADHQRTRDLLVTVEIALAFCLLVSAGLTLRSIWHLQDVRLGYRTDHLLVFGVSLPRTKYTTPDRQGRFFQQALESLKGIPGVRNAAMTSFLPVEGPIRYYINVDGRPRLQPGQAPVASLRLISPEYFSILGIPLVRGRLFTEHDRPDALPVAVISESMARHLFPHEEALGRRLTRGPDGIFRQIVGIVQDTKGSPIEERTPDQLYLPVTQSPWHTLSFLLQTAGDPAQSSELARRALLPLDKDQPVAHIQTLEQAVREQVTYPRLLAWLLGAFAAVALLLAAVGIYGVTAYSVARRLPEFGIRLALGASGRHIFRLVLQKGLRLAAAGLVVGLLASLALGRTLRTLLYGVSPSDPMTLLSLTGLLAVVVVLACLLPARRAVCTSPVSSLRNE